MWRDTRGHLIGSIRHNPISACPVCGASGSELSARLLLDGAMENGRLRLYLLYLRFEGLCCNMRRTLMVLELLSFTEFLEVLGFLKLLGY